jgi:hypothetical protein
MSSPVDLNTRLSALETALGLPHTAAASITSAESALLASKVASLTHQLEKARYRSAHLARAYDSQVAEIAQLKAELAAARKQ